MLGGMWLRALMLTTLGGVTCLAGCGRIGFDIGGGGIAGDDGGTSDGEMIDPTPFVPANPCNCTHVAGGDQHSCVVLGSGAVRCWGGNFSGQLGNTTQMSSLVPIDVGGVTDASSVVAGGDQIFVQRTSSIGCWGYDGQGQLGNGTTGGGGTVSAVSGITSAAQIDASRWHTCFVDVPGTAACNGLNNYQQLVDGTAAGSRTAPSAGVGMADAKGVAAGEYFTFFVRATGAVECAGDNMYGQLGDGTTTQRGNLMPVSGLTGAVEVVAGRYFACARRGDGTVACWGQNNSGQLGNGTNTDSPVPVPVTGLTDATHLSAGQFFACAIRATGTAVCWGSNGSGVLGIGVFGGGTASSRNTPVDVLHLTSITVLEAGDEHACAIAGGGLYCWGSNQYGQLGTGAGTLGFPCTIATPVAGF